MTNPNDAIHPWGTDSIHGNLGLTKREYFAAMAMQGLMANATTYLTIAEALTERDPEKAAQVVAAMAAIQADALIKELSK